MASTSTAYTGAMTHVERARSARSRNRVGDRKRELQDKDLVTIHGKIERIRFFSEETGWMAGVLSVTKGGGENGGGNGGMGSEGETKSLPALDPAVSFTASYHERIAAGAPVILRGKFEINEKYGKQFKCVAITVDKAPDNEGLVNLISANKEIHGIGPVKAAELVGIYGVSGLESATGFAVDFAREHHLKVETVEALHKFLSEDREELETKAWLSSLGLTPLQINKLVIRYGAPGLRKVIHEDVYQVMGEIEGFGFRRTDEIAQKLGTPKDAPNRIKAGVMYCLNKEIENGHTWVGRRELAEMAFGELALDTMTARKEIDTQIEALEDGGQIVQIIPASKSESGTRITTPFFWKCEYEVHKKLCMYGKQRNTHFSSLSESEVETEADRGSGDLTAVPTSQTGDWILNDKQRQAVLNFIRNKITLISGGAGVGKTFVIRRITEICARHNVSVLCCAPTGKAARRIEESTGRESCTIHRALEYNGDVWGRDRNCPITHGCVIVDEVSMVDSPLMWRLFDAIDFTKTCLVLVGDHNQLPPVGPGAWLRDLVESRPTSIINTTILTECMRQAGILKAFSNKVLIGCIEDTPPKSKENTVDSSDCGPLPWYKFATFDPSEPVKFHDFLRGCIRSHLESSFNVDPLTQFQILCPMKKGPFGTDCLNAVCQREIQIKYFSKDVPGELGIGGVSGIGDGGISEGSISKKNYSQPIYVGDRVIQTRNNRETGIMNGQIGYVREIDGKSGKMYVEFEDGERGADGKSGSVIVMGVPRGEQKDLRLAYALTVHKSQGSEFPCVLVVCSKPHFIMLNRKLIYTAVTRAQKICILCGDPKGFGYAARSDGDRDNERRTMFDVLGAHLKGEVQGEI